MVKQIMKYSRATYLILSYFQLILFFVLLKSLYMRRLYFPGNGFSGSLSRTMPLAGYQLGFIILMIMFTLLLVVSWMSVKKGKHKIVLFNILFIIQSILIVPIIFIIYNWQLAIVKVGYLILIPIMLLSILMILEKIKVKRSVAS